MASFPVNDPMDDAAGHMRNNHFCPHHSSHFVKGPEQEGPG